MPIGPFNFFRRRRRARLLGRPLPIEAAAAIARSVPHYSALTEDERRRLADLARIIVAEKVWEGGRGFAITDAMKWTIAAQAALLLLGLDTDPLCDAVYPGLRTIIVYASGYIAPHERVGPGGIITVGSSNLGEAWYRGPVIVSWADAAHGGRHGGDGRNLVLHEFAHKLDMLDGVVDGTPPLPRMADGDAYACWREVMTAAFERLRAHAATGQVNVLDYYGATNPAEFFAVATEAFFERPRDLRASQGALYETLTCYYRQDPAARLDAFPT